MKRYNFYPLTNRGMMVVADDGMFCIYSDYETSEDSQGQYYKVDDVDKEIKRLRDAIDKYTENIIIHEVKQ